MQAIIISTYKNPEYLQRLIDFFSKKYHVFVHLDSKSKIQTSFFKHKKNVHIYKKYRICWGSYNHLLAILFLLREAMKYSDINYFHIISGSDLPVKKIEDYDKFENNQQIYMEHLKLPQDLNFLRRYQYGTRFPNMDQRARLVKIVNQVYQVFKRPNKLLGGTFTDSQIYKGLIWLSLPRNAVEYVFKYNEKNDFLKNIYHVSLPEEIFFQTILENSYFKKYIAKNNLVYNDWTKKRNGSLPAILDSSDYMKIISSDSYFARKIDPVISKDLIDSISKNINNF